MAREYLCLYYSYLDTIHPLNDEERGRLLTAILTYGITGQEPALPGNERFVFPGIRAQIDRDASKYRKTCEKNSQNIMNRWNGPRSDDTTVYEPIQPNTTVYETYQGKGKDKGKGKDEIGVTETRVKRFTPPTADEVRAYCLERKNSVDAEKFIDHYSSNGWRVGKNPMKDWKAAVRTWERSEYGSSKPKAVSDYDPYANFERF